MLWEPSQPKEDIWTNDCVWFYGEDGLKASYSGYDVKSVLYYGSQ